MRVIVNHVTAPKSTHQQESREQVCHSGTGVHMSIKKESTEERLADDAAGGCGGCRLLLGKNEIISIFGGGVDGSSNLPLEGLSLDGVKLLLLLLVALFDFLPVNTFTTRAHVSSGLQNNERFSWSVYTMCHSSS